MSEPTSDFIMHIGRRWHEVPRCHAIAKIEHIDGEMSGKGIYVHLCKRFRWHLGPCRAAGQASTTAEGSSDGTV